MLTTLKNAFKIKEIRTENLSQINFNGYTYIIIVPDNLIDIVKKQDIKLKDIKIQKILKNIWKTRSQQRI